MNRFDELFNLLYGLLLDKWNPIDDVEFTYFNETAIARFNSKDEMFYIQNVTAHDGLHDYSYMHSYYMELYTWMIREENEQICEAELEKTIISLT